MRAFPLRAASPSDSAATQFGAAQTGAGNAVIQEQALDAAIYGLARSDPRSSAIRLLTLDQAIGAGAIVIAFLAAMVFAPIATLVALNAAVAAFFLAVFATRAVLAALSLNDEPYAEEASNAPPIADADLPTVTILAPLYREAETLPSLARAIDALDYPGAKLDVKLIFEENDPETLAEARRLGLAPRYEFVVTPASQPQTKPKACNYALAFARGDLVVIYDAEDVPEPNQLRLAARAFANGPDNLVCAQARLNYYNAEENWLTRLFALEYALWFDSLLPALQRLGAPIPLGGTSNILRTDALRAIGGWDAFNVTEDADLGLRIARYGGRTTLIASTTFEEANCELGNWLRQRSRWMKGFMQTWLVQTRRGAGFGPRGDWRAGLSCHLFLGGTAFSALINPVLWLLFFGWITTRSTVFETVMPPAVAGASLIALTLGNALFVWLMALAPLKRDWPALSLWALLAPVYWQLASLAAYKALWQLVTRPFYWEKTRHAISRAARARRDEALQSFDADAANASAQARRAA